MRVYHCDVCAGLHVGHDPVNPETHRYRAYQRSLRDIEGRLSILAAEREALVRDRDLLLRQLGHQIGGQPIVVATIALVRRLAEALRWPFGT